MKATDDLRCLVLILDHINLLCASDRNRVIAYGVSKFHVSVIRLIFITYFGAF